MTTLGSSTAVSFMGMWLVEGSAASTWIANNSPNSLQLSGLTQGLSYIKMYKMTGDNDKGTSIPTSWHVGDGVKNFFTYGDDDGLRVMSHKISKPTFNAIFTEKAYFKRFRKRHNRGSASKVYMFNRYDTSAGAYETFYNNAQSSKKYVPILLRDITFNWGQETNLKWVARTTVEEVWR